MDWLLIGSCGMMAWVVLCLLTGERLRRDQQRMIDSHLAERAATEKKKAEEPIPLS